MDSVKEFQMESSRFTMSVEHRGFHSTFCPILVSCSLIHQPAWQRPQKSPTCWTTTGHDTARSVARTERKPRPSQLHYQKSRQESWESNAPPLDRPKAKDLSRLDRYNRDQK
ncbi:hypothetical protein P168DRAFT_68035 [Aspergillus campestris IBT 28561]|uniref:Uncharacterized protein n=1 Tax=Aspergillus campestris (strain IBT 28561) TaxID=1392248 RepID=A0A2I1CS29_ASPC2|nr:uncharacterized protein P168DRAFT_68035 [Aspergillus campestris IBT 28561]PKY00429.1 hypothetical protein P168DRAFT_68035 [Aspergillus campestris IBT 28561]